MDQICCTMCVWSYGCIELHGWTLTRWIQLNLKNAIEHWPQGSHEIDCRNYLYYMDELHMNENNSKNKNDNIDEIGIMDEVNYHMDENLTYGPNYTWMRINSINKNHM